MIIVGVLVLVIAGAVAVNAIYTNRGSEHQIADGFSIFGYLIEGSTGRVFLYGAITGAAVLAGLYLTLVGSRRAVRSRIATRRELRHVQRDKHQLEQERDQLVEKLEHDGQSNEDRDRPSQG
ncbi:MAG: hypothetical protein ACRDT4_24000 [Micromonosporaceae bacterium]